MYVLCTTPMYQKNRNKFKKRKRKREKELQWFEELVVTFEWRKLELEHGGLRWFIAQTLVQQLSLFFLTFILKNLGLDQNKNSTQTSGLQHSIKVCTFQMTVWCVPCASCSAWFPLDPSPAAGSSSST
jgi:hypothetical protein